MATAINHSGVAHRMIYIGMSHLANAAGMNMFWLGRCH